jgi:hypothetical protein
MSTIREHSNSHVLHDDRGPERKRLFIGLVFATSLLVCLALVLLWVVPFIGLKAIHPVAPWILGGLVCALVLAIGFVSFALVWKVMRGRSMPFFDSIHGVTVKLYLPLMTLLGRLLGISKERIRGSFISVNNELVYSRTQTFEPEQLLLLMPHCLQKSDCSIRLTYDINNCKRCGRCPIKGLLALSEHYGVHLAVATGGTIARRIVIQKRPKLILAVACERDLAEGIQDTYPIPVYGVLNLRPEGPCLNTLVPLDVVEETLRKFIKPERLPKTPPVFEPGVDLLPQFDAT